MKCAGFDLGDKIAGRKIKESLSSLLALDE